MTTTLLRGLVAATLLLSATGAHAQGAPGAVGTWKVEYARGQRMENGELTPIMGAATLAIVAKGDSLFGTLETGPRPDGQPATPGALSGVATRDGALFVQKRQVSVSRNGAESTVEVVMTWDLHMAGDAVTGTLKATAADPGMPPLDSPVKGKRIRG